MTANPHHPNLSASASGAAEDTLRVIASLPAPAGLEDRLRTALRKTPQPARVLAWPTGLKPHSDWMRSAAAAAIVLVVAGGGWGVYTRVEQNRPAKVIAMPPRIGAPGGFSGAGAMRTPQTIPGPAAPQPAQPKTAKKAVMPPGTKSARKSSAAGQAAAQK
jgi:hypothetical protein